MSFTAVFGGYEINPTDLGYLEYDISANLTLVWPFQATTDSNVIAPKLDINASVGSLLVAMPDASMVSVGQDVLINNVGANTFTVVDSAGTTLIAIPPGNQYYLYLIDNSTTYGTWRVVLFGSITSPLAASALAGAGLRANAALLDQNLPTLALNSSYTFGINDRAELAKNGGGAVTWGFGAAATLGNGWFVYVVNGGSGNITLDPNGAETIDGGATKTIGLGESCIVFSDGSNLWTVGYGRALSSTVTGASVNLAGSGTTTLNATQVAAQVQNFTGALTGARIVEYGVSVGYWFVYNNTSGAYSTTFRVNGADPGVTVTQGAFSILRSDGANMSVAFTATTGTVTSVATTAGELTGGPITMTGTLGLANTTVIPGTYGTAADAMVATVDAKGRLTAMSTTPIQIVYSQITPFTSAQFATIVTDETGTGSLVFANGPVLISPVVGTQSSSDNSTLAASTAYVTAAIAAAVAGLQAQMFQTGDFLHTSLPTARTGWVFATGSIGSATSGATQRANADTVNLFTHLWNTYSNTLCPVSGGRGASAAADFAANKTITMLDARGMILAAAENMGGTNRGNLGSGVSPGFTGTASLGESAGAKTDTLDTTKIPAHTHDQAGPATGLGGSGGGSTLFGSPGSGNTGSTGGGLPHNNTQPTLVCNILIKL